MELYRSRIVIHEPPSDVATPTRHRLAVLAVVVAAPLSAGAQIKPNDLEFTVPAGYLQQRQGDVIILAPASADPKSPCMYGLAGRHAGDGAARDRGGGRAGAGRRPRLASAGRSARRDARHEPGWLALRWWRAALRPISGQRQVMNAMALVCPPAPTSSTWCGAWATSPLPGRRRDVRAAVPEPAPAGMDADGGRALAKAMAAGGGSPRGPAGIQQLSFRPMAATRAISAARRASA